MMILDELYRPVKHELDQVKARLGELWGEALALVHGRDLKPPAMGGKLLRPALCLLSAGASGARDVDYFVSLATGMEVLHLAALVHDDVVDSSETRRGQRSLNAQWDNHTAVLGGDYIMARGIEIIGVYDSVPVILSALDSICQMAAGELNNFGRGQEPPDEESCISLARHKTGSLFAITCATPTLLVETNHRDALYQYGMSLGVAFQLIDDVLDLAQDEEILGKPSCRDIVEGKQTLPILYLREAVDDAGKQRLDRMRGADPTEADRDWVHAMLIETGARGRTEKLAKAYATSARAALAPLPDTPYRDSMRDLVDFVLARVA